MIHVGVCRIDWRDRLCTCVLVLCITSLLATEPLLAGPGRSSDSADGVAEFVDLSLLVGTDYPCTWPQEFPLFHFNHYRSIGALSPYNIDILTIDPNTGTQMDTPPHSVALPGSGLPTAGAFGTMFSDRVPAWQFGGEACIVDVRDLRDAAEPGHSALVRREHIVAWEKKHRPLRFGDVVFVRSDFSDYYYRPFPEGRRFVADPVEGTVPAWPDPDPGCMESLASRGVMAVGTDSPSMGPRPDLAEPTHLAGLKHGMIFTEGATSLGKLPSTGAFYCMLPPKHAGSGANEGRALAIQPGPVATWLIEAARAKRAIDLSVTLGMDVPVSWPGVGIGNQRQPYLKVLFMYSPLLNSYQQTHVMDSHTGTHLVPPAYSLPAAGFDNRNYSATVQQWLADYEAQYGQRGTSDVTTDKVPVSQTCGWARVIDVTHLVGAIAEDKWPASPEIRPEDIKKYERESGPLREGDVVIFHSGHTDRYFKAFPQGYACMTDPVNGKSEGWPAPGPEAIDYLASRGIRCVATDGPTLGGVDPRRALMTYWALGTRGMVGVEFLTGVGRLPARAYFLFAAVKIRGGYGGPGRAIAFY